MKKIKFREQRPCRTYIGNDKSNYRLYKDQLTKDFNGKCGYTNCSHFWFGGKSNFHIDHFAPYSKFPHLKKKYSNLIYCCSYVNRAKSNDWPTDDENLNIFNGKGYLDPCEEDYNEFFYRDQYGQIRPNQDKPEAKYMYKKLKLFLKRYGIIWKLDQLKIRIESLTKLMENDVKEKENNEIKDLYIELNREFHKYLNYLKEEQ